MLARRGEYTILAFQDFYMDVQQPAVIKEYEGKGENVRWTKGPGKV
jgi:hypothetical protein